MTLNRKNQYVGFRFGNKNQLPYIILSCFIIFLQVITSIVLKSTSVLTNKNTLITLTVWCVFIYLAYHFNNILLLLGPIILLLLNEFLYVNFNIDAFDGEARTKLFYDLTTTNFINNNNNNTNLTEGIYLRNLADDKSLMSESEAKELDKGKANQNKFDKFFLYLNIEPHEYKNLRILDMGCGNGDFIKYCNSLGIQASGLSISSEQVSALKKQGLDVYLGSFRNLHPQFIGKYDIVTFWGSLEHITQSYPYSKSGEKKAEEVIKKTMSHVKEYYKPDSRYKLLFNTTLHLNKKVVKDTLDIYILERAYGGWCFNYESGQTLSDKIETVGFNKIKQDDFTYHYYMASRIDPTHFGVPSKPDVYLMAIILFGVFINPHLIAMAIYTLRGEWMWMFDNKSHYFDNTCASCSYIEERSKRPATLLWTVNKLNDAR
jgi:SAM-dependent methyltransferase